MRRLLMILALAVLGASPAFAQEKVYAEPPMVQRPTPDQIKALTPAGAADLSRPDWIELRCGFDAEGRLIDCTTGRLTNMQIGLQGAAIELSKFYRIEPDFAKARQGGVAVVYLTFGPPWGEPQPWRNPVITRPEWVQKPTGAQVNAVFPRAAIAARQGGRVVMSCTVKADGTLKDCKIISETPAGLGFGEAAKRLAPAFRMQARTADGVSVEGANVRIPLSFSAP